MGERLALEGGRPVRQSLLPYGRHLVTEEDRATVMRVLEGDWLTSGPFVEEFEQALADLTGTSHAVAVSSGTAGLHLAAIAAGIRPGRDVITSPLTFVASANTALFCGARPRFADIDPASMCMNPLDLEARLDGDVKMVVPVHFAGRPCEMDEIVKIAKANETFVLEDAAHALGARYHGRPVGSLADAAVFSFHPVKHITTLEGGAVVTSDPDYAETIRRLRNHGISHNAASRLADSTWEYEIKELGFNYRLNDVGSALGLSQLRRLDQILATRRKLANRYLRELRLIDGVSAFEEPLDSEHAWHIFPVLLDAVIDREWAFRAMQAENIAVNVHYIPVHLFQLYRTRFGLAPGDYPAAEDAYNRLLTLPLFEAMTDSDQDDVLAALEKVLAHASRRPNHAHR